MKTKSAILASVIVILGVTAILANSKKGTSSFGENTATVESLNERLSTLEERVAKLESENQRLRSALLKREPGALVPKENWKEFKHNGETIYAIPLNNNKELE